MAPSARVTLLRTEIVHLMGKLADDGYMLPDTLKLLVTTIMSIENKHQLEDIKKKMIWAGGELRGEAPDPGEPAGLYSLAQIKHFGLRTLEHMRLAGQIDKSLASLLAYSLPEMVTRREVEMIRTVLKAAAEARHKLPKIPGGDHSKTRSPCVPPSPTAKKSSSVPVVQPSPRKYLPATKKSPATTATHVQRSPRKQAPATRKFPSTTAVQSQASPRRKTSPPKKSPPAEASADSSRAQEPADKVTAPEPDVNNAQAGTETFQFDRQSISPASTSPFSSSREDCECSSPEAGEKCGNHASGGTSDADPPLQGRRVRFQIPPAHLSWEPFPNDVEYFELRSPMGGRQFIPMMHTSPHGFFAGNCNPDVEYPYSPSNERIEEYCANIAKQMYELGQANPTEQVPRDMTPAGMPLDSLPEGAEHESKVYWKPPVPPQKLSQVKFGEQPPVKPTRNRGLSRWTRFPPIDVEGQYVWPPAYVPSAAEMKQLVPIYRPTRGERVMRPPVITPMNAKEERLPTPRPAAENMLPDIVDGGLVDSADAMEEDDGFLAHGLTPEDENVVVPVNCLMDNDNLISKDNSTPGDGSMPEDGFTLPGGSPAQDASTDPDVVMPAIPEEPELPN